MRQRFVLVLCESYCLYYNTFFITKFQDFFTDKYWFTFLSCGLNGTKIHFLFLQNMMTNYKGIKNYGIIKESFDNSLKLKMINIFETFCIGLENKLQGLTQHFN